MKKILILCLLPAWLQAQTTATDAHGVSVTLTDNIHIEGGFTYTVVRYDSDTWGMYVLDSVEKIPANVVSYGVMYPRFDGKIMFPNQQGKYISWKDYAKLEPATDPDQYIVRSWKNNRYQVADADQLSKK